MKSPKTLAHFLEHLAEGRTISVACRLASVGRSTVYERRSNDPKFAAPWDEALEIGIELLEEEARRRAVDGVVVPKTVAGEQVEVTEYSDALLMFLLKAKSPGVYREHFKHELSGPDGGPVPIEAKVDRDRLLRSLEEIGLIARQLDRRGKVTRSP